MVKNRFTRIYKSIQEHSAVYGGDELNAHIPFSFRECYKNDSTFSPKTRLIKAKKILAVISDYKGGKVSKLSCLDVGCSTGLISEYLGKHFKKVAGVDVDEEAVNLAKKRVKRGNVSFLLSKESKLPLEANSFDVAIFNQVYEHAEDPEKLLAEIKRVLKPGGVCYFGARNKFWLFDGHYPLPFLSWFSRKISEKYFQLLGKKRKYDIELSSYRQLKDLVKGAGFEYDDYSLKVVENPKKFNALDIVPTFLGINFPLYILAGVFYMFIPNYIWILVKE